MQSKYFGAKPLEAVLPALATIESVQTALHDEFGERSAEIVNKLKSGLPLLDCELSAYDIITDIVGNESAVEWSTAGLGSEDEFPINVMRFGTVYWIEAQEFDPLGYFETIEQAIDVAEICYEPFITALAEQKKDDA
jgi:hypothetical protein